MNFVRQAPVDSEICSGQFVGPIQYRIWKQMKASLYPSNDLTVMIDGTVSMNAELYETTLD